ncbi:MAG TPA: phenylalanine--tRNA ligase subunit beta [Candidatus Thermoplasmatota archaeon]|nr:phenylalanine--tRNA ligase subunit beta [Candidatus Thermoplasmatota archaeon]
MPVIRFDARELTRLVGKKIPRGTLAEKIPMIGADVDDVSGDRWAIEFFPDRPDLFTVEGIARAMRAFLDVKPGLATYKVAAPKSKLVVDPSVAKVRPHITAAVVRGVDVTEDRLEGLIALQEALHWGLGARRRKVAIGVHDHKPVKGPFVYKAVDPESIRFVPLASEEEMDLAEVLKRHPKGQDYAHLLAGHGRFPVILDAAGNLLSFPPIINGALTTVTTKTRDVLVDVTGWDAWAVERALNLVVTSLAESGGRIEAITIETPPAKRGAKAKTRRAPALEPEKRTLAVADVEKLLGLPFTPKEAAACLARMGYGAKPSTKGKVAVEVPAWRTDILHDVDLIEDVAIGYGINEFPHERPHAVTYGTPLPGARAAERARQSLVGLGFLEVMSLSLSNARDQFARMQLARDWSVDVMNPLSEDHTLLRVHVLPSLLNVLARNAHRDLPQRVFEVGTVTVEREDGTPRHEKRVAGAWIASKVGYSDAKSVVQALERDLGWSAEIGPGHHASYVEGRVAAVTDTDGRTRGVFGELSPAVITAFGLANPVVAFEFVL